MEPLEKASPRVQGSPEVEVPQHIPLLAHMIHEHFFGNLRSAAAMSLQLTVTVLNEQRIVAPEAVVR
jgi:hypothetical protein